MPEGLIEIAYAATPVAAVRLDPVQDTFPWYFGDLIPHPAALGPLRRFIDAFAAADLEWLHCPLHPDEEPYADSPLAAYVAVIRDHLHNDRGPAWDPPASDAAWLAPWRSATPAVVAAYLAFLDPDRWQARVGGQEIVGIPRPPGLDLSSRRFAFRP